MLYFAIDKRWSFKRIFKVGCLVFFSVMASYSYALDKGEVSVEHSPSGHFDFYVFALTWQPSYCTINNLKSCPNTFKIHGLWPYFKAPVNGRVKNYHPSYCFASPGCSSFEDCSIDKRVIHLISENTRLKKWFPDDPSALLKHEWRKHGTCAGVNQTEYFDLIETFKQGLDYQSLTKKIQAKNGQPMTRKEVLSTLPGNTSLWCKQYNGKDYLYEVHFFIGKQGEAFHHANTQIGDVCPEQFIAPVY